MKKLIAILLMLALAIPLTANLTFAEEISDIEKNEIIKSAYESYLVYDVLKGFNSFSEDEWFVDDKKEILFTQIDPVQKKEFGFGFYKETTFKATSSDEVFELIDKYYVGYNKEKMWIFVDTDNNSFEINDGKTFLSYYTEKRLDLPLALIIDGTVYTYSHQGLAYGSGGYPVFDEAVVNYIDFNNALITLDVVSYDDPDTKDEDLTIMLVKTEHGWKISGGTLFTEGFISGFLTKWYSDAPPATGENTVLYLAVACAAVVAMTAVVVRRKREAL